MSEREDIQTELANHLSDLRRVWNAPYGVLTGTERLARGGYVRTVTFGMARTLDATVYIWSPTRLTVRAQGPAYHIFASDTYYSLDDLLKDLREVEGAA